MKIIAKIYTPFREKFGIPRQSGIAEAVTGRIVFEPEYRTPDALRGIDGYSHLWLLWHFSEAEREGWSPLVRPPRLGGNKKVGVFATRSPFRPNNIGLSSVRLIGIEHTKDEGDVLLVSGVDMLSGTPIIDIKPYLPYTDSHPDAVGGFADAVMGDNLEVNISEELLQKIPEDNRESILTLLRDDPRPHYQSDPDRIYGMIYENTEVHFTVENKTLTVKNVNKK